MDGPWLSGNKRDEFGEASGSGEWEGLRGFEDVMRAADVGERVNGDIDIFEDELAMGRQPKVGSWRM